MTGRPAAFSALALASTASVADSEMADTRAETLVDMGSILAPGGRCPAAIYSAGAGVAARFDAGAGWTYTAWTGSRAVVCGSMPEWLYGWLAVLRREAVLCLKALSMYEQRPPQGAVARSNRAVAQLARVPVSKTGGWGFESLLPCEFGPDLRIWAGRPANV